MTSFTSEKSMVFLDDSFPSWGPDGGKPKKITRETHSLGAQILQSPQAFYDGESRLFCLLGKGWARGLFQRGRLSFTFFTGLLPGTRRVSCYTMTACWDAKVGESDPPKKTTKKREPSRNKKKWLFSGANLLLVLGRVFVDLSLSCTQVSNWC